MRLHAVGDEVFAGGRLDGNRAGRRNVVGGDAVSKNGQHLGAVNVRERRRRLRHVFEKRRQLDVRRFWIPLVDIAFGKRHRLPVRIAFEHFAVLLAVLRCGN